MNLSLSKNLISDDHPIEVCENIYLGSVHAAFSTTSLNQYKITHIVNISGLPATYPNLYNYLSIDLGGGVGGWLSDSKLNNIYSSAMGIWMAAQENYCFKNVTFNKVGNYRGLADAENLWISGKEWPNMAKDSNTQHADKWGLG